MMLAAEKPIAQARATIVARWVTLKSAKKGT